MADNILVTRADRIGDLVLSTPVFSSLRRRFPEARIACLTFLENREIVTENPFIDEVILYDKKESEKGWLYQIEWCKFYQPFPLPQPGTILVRLG